MNNMLVPSLLVTLGYWLTTRLEMISWTSGCVSRPILVGPIVGLLLGDIKTGIIMGGSLEAIFMGVNAIGGQKPADQNIGTCVPVAYVILTGASMEAAIALAVPFATVVKSLQNITKPVKAFMLPLIMNAAKKGDRKKIELLNILGFMGLWNIDNYISLFLLVFLGVNSLDAVIGFLPSFVTTGFNVAANILVGVGLGLTLSMIWSKELGCFFLIGFILYNALGLTQIQIAVLGTSIAIIYYFMMHNKQQNTSMVENKEDIF